MVKGSAVRRWDRGWEKQSGLVGGEVLEVSKVVLSSGETSVGEFNYL